MTRATTADGRTAKSLKPRLNLALRNSELLSPSRLIMFVLSDIADHDTLEVPDERVLSQAELARQTGLCKSTVKEHLKRLETDGWVTRTRPSAAERYRGVRTGYRLAVPGAAASEAVTQGQEMAHAPGPADNPLHGQQMAPGRVRRQPAYKEDNKNTNETHTCVSTAAPIERPDARRICEHLAGRREGVDRVTRPEVTDEWIMAAVALLDEDHRTEAEAHRMIDWAHDSDFWAPWIKYPWKLREKWETMAAQQDQARRASAPAAAARFLAPPAAPTPADRPVAAIPGFAPPEVIAEPGTRRSLYQQMTDTIRTNRANRPPAAEWRMPALPAYASG